MKMLPTKTMKFRLKQLKFKKGPTLVQMVFLNIFSPGTSKLYEDGVHENYKI